VPDLQPDRPFVLAIATGDWHLCDTPPSYRQNEPDWWAAQLRPIDQIKALQRKFHGVPILFGGDLFDRAKSSPELVNWTLRHMPVVYGIPGNHDLVHHRYEDVNKSSFQTVVEAGKIIDLKPGIPHPLSGLTVTGYPFGVPVKSIASNMIDGLNVALIHAYCWRQGHGYQGAPDDKRVKEWERKVTNFPIALYSDNHHHFIYRGRDTTIVNMGCIIRRRRDESHYEPSVALIWSDGEVSRKKLDCSEDVYAPCSTVDKEVADKGEGIDALKLIKSLKGLQQKNRIDFQATVTELMTTLGVGEEVRTRVMESMEAER
jgi:hypothetical protein